MPSASCRSTHAWTLVDCPRFGGFPRGGNFMRQGCVARESGKKGLRRRWHRHPGGPTWVGKSGKSGTAVTLWLGFAGVFEVSATPHCPLRPRSGGRARAVDRQAFSARPRGLRCSEFFVRAYVSVDSWTRALRCRRHRHPTSPRGGTLGDSWTAARSSVARDRSRALPTKRGVFGGDGVGGFVDSGPEMPIPSASNRSTAEWTRTDSFPVFPPPLIGAQSDS